MKKLLLMLAAVGMIFTACENNGGIDEENGDLSSSKIATITKQGANIKATIATLETTMSAANSTIAALNEQPATRDSDNNGVKTMIAALEERVAALEQIISDLTEYTQDDLAKMQDWATATFATLEQQETLAAELAKIKAILEGFESVSTTELSDAITASEASMKQWVNEQLSGYVTIAEMNSQVATLKENLTAELNEEAEKIVATLTALMNDTKQEYEKAITDAIQNMGIINEQIAADIATTNKRIDEELATINKRLDDIEKRLDEIEDILEGLVNRIQTISYIKKYGSEATPVATSAEGTSVTLDFEISPRSAIEGLELKWKEFVKVQAVYSGTTDFIDMPITSFTADAKKGIITVVASGDNLSYEFYSGKQKASLRLEISDGNNDKRSEYIPIAPQLWMRDGMDLDSTNNEIYYTTADSNPITLANIEGFGATLQTNLYDREKGLYVLKFDGDILSIGDKAFYNCSNLTGIAIPNSVTSIGNSAFYGCTGELRINSKIVETSYTEYSYDILFKGGEFTKLTIGNDVTSIGDWAFWCCNSLTSVTIGNSVTSIGDYAFNSCASLTSVTIGNSVTSIGYAVFSGCDSLTSVTIGDGVTSIGAEAFSGCTSLTSVTIPDSVISIGIGAFHYCSSLTSITIPDSVTSVGAVAFLRCTSLEAFYGRYASEDNHCLVVNGVLLSFAPGGLTEYTIPHSVTSIGEQAFSYCDNLISVTIPDSVTSIGICAFIYCSSLTSVYCKATTPPTGGINMFYYGIASGLKIYVPTASVEAYKSAQYWSDYASQIVGYDF